MNEPFDPPAADGHGFGDNIADTSVESIPPPPAPPDGEPTVVERRPTVVEESEVAPQPEVRSRTTSAADDVDRTSVLRVPTFSPVAPVVGVLTSWGAIVAAVAILGRVGVDLGLNLGIASGGPGADGFWAGVWLLVVNGGGFVLGGYTAARMARANGVRHAVLVWLVAMLATGADALVEVIDSGVTGVVRLIPGVPFWADTELTTRGEAIGALAIFAGVALGGAIIGGTFGQAANRLDRTDGAVVRT